MNLHWTPEALNEEVVRATLGRPTGHTVYLIRRLRDGFYWFGSGVWIADRDFAKGFEFQSVAIGAMVFDIPNEAIEDLDIVLVRD